MKSKVLKRMIAYLLCVIMVFGSSSYAFAEGSSETQSEEIVMLEDCLEEAVDESLEEDIGEVIINVEAESEETLEVAESEEAVEEVVESEEAVEEVVESEETVEEVAESEEATEEAEETIVLTQDVDGTTITLSGLATSFEKNREYSLSVTKIESETDVEVIGTIEEALNKVAEEKKKVVADYQAFDIKLIADGEEVQPLGPVEVKFSGKTVAASVKNEEIETSVIHVDEKTGESQDMEAVTTQEKDVEIETTHFSIYVYVELEEDKEITLTVEYHLPQADNETKVETNEINLPDRFQGSIDELVDVCMSEEAKEAYLLESVWVYESETWKEITEVERLDLDTDTKIKLVYSTKAVELPEKFFKFSDITRFRKVTKNKTATKLDKDDKSKVTLTVGGDSVDLSSDIVLILGHGPASNYDYVVESIHRMLIATDGTPTKIKLGFVGFADDTERELVMPLTEMKDTYPGNKVSDYRVSYMSMLSMMTEAEAKKNGLTEEQRTAENAKRTEENAIRAAENAKRKAEYEALIAAGEMDEAIKNDMEFVIAKALEECEKVYDGINLESALVTARDMLMEDETVPAERKHMIVVSTGLTYWFDDEEGKPAFTLRNNGNNQPQHLDYRNWLQHRNGTTSTSGGYKIPAAYWKYNADGSLDGKASWEDFWKDIVSWVEKDQNRYVYTVRDTYREFVNRNSNRLIVDSEDKKMAEGVEMLPYVSGSNPKTTAKAQHAAGYERAQYDAWVIYNQMQVPKGETFNTVFKDAEGNYITVEGLGYNCYSIANGVSSKPGEEDRWLASNQIGYNFMRMLGGDNTVNYRDGDTSFFAPIENKIINSISVGTTVVDYIGYNDDPIEGYDFDFVDDVTKLLLTRAGVEYLVKQVENDQNNPEVTSTYVFTNPNKVVEGEEAEPTFKLEYYRGNGKDTERFVWSFGEYVTDFEAASLEYQVFLKTKSTVLGDHVANTNRYAVLNPVSSAISDELPGEPGEPQYFPIPQVQYTVNHIIRILKTDSSIPARPLEGAVFTVNGEEITTGEDGFAEYELPGYGSFTVKEIKAPNGFVLTDEVYTLTVEKDKEPFVKTSDGKVYSDMKIAEDGAIVVTIANKAIVRIVKVGSIDNVKLQGAEFKLGDEIKTTGENGIVEFELPGYGSYQFGEVKAPTGYLLSDIKYTINLEKGKAPSVTTPDDTECNYTVTKDGVIEIKISNLPVYELPSTGGSGIYWITISGMILMMGAALILHNQRCKAILIKTN